MRRTFMLLGGILPLLGLGLVGCGNRKGDLGAELEGERPINLAAEEVEGNGKPSGKAADASVDGERKSTAPAADASKAKVADESKAGSAELAETKPVDVAVKAAPGGQAQRAPKAAESGKIGEKAAEEPVAEAVALPAAGGAQSTGGQAVAPEAESKAGPVLARKAAPGGAGEETAAPVGGPEDAKDGEKPKPVPAETEETPEQRAARLLKEAAALTSLKEQAKSARADMEFQTGLRLYRDLRYEQALKHFESAYRLDPTNRKALSYLRKTRSLLGVHVDRIADKIRSLEQVERVKIQASLVALANAMEEAGKYEVKGSAVPLELEDADQEKILADQLSQLRQAQDRFRRVKEIINWMPPPIDLPGERKAVEEALRRVRQKLLDKEDEISFLRRKQAMEMAEKTRLRETELFKARVNKLLEQVAELYNRGQYSATERLALRILQIDPFNGGAEGWKRRARAASHAAEAETSRAGYREARKRTWEAVDSAHIPYGELLVYPSNWDQISRRTERAAIGKSKVEEQWKKDIKKKLHRKVSFEFVDTPLNEAVAFLRSLTDVTMIVDPKVLEAGPPPPINLRVTDMSLELALEWILKLADLGFTLKDNAIFISKKSTLVEDVELRIYDVSDLTQQIPDFPGPDFQLTTAGDPTQGGGAGGGGGGGLGGNPFQAAPQAQQLTPQSIADMIRNRVHPDSWDPNQGTSIEERAGKLVVMQRPEIHSLIDQLLSNFRATQKLMVNIESRFLIIREAYLEDIGVEFQGLDPNVLFGDFGDVRRALAGSAGNPLAVQPRLPGLGDVNPQAVNVPFPGFTEGPDSLSNGGIFSTVGAILNHTINFFTSDPTTISARDTGNQIRQGGLSAQVTILNNTQIQAFIRALASRENTSTLMAPRLTVFNTQRAHMFVARQQSYVADYEISGDSYDPIVRQFLVGVVLDVKPTVSADRHYVTLEMRPTLTELVNFQTRQIDSFTIQQGGNVIIPILLSFPVQFPELSIRRIRTTAAVPDSGILLLGGLYRNIKFNAENGVPFFSDLPVIGRLFRFNVVDNAKSNLSILVSPRIILFNEEEAKL